MIYKRENIFERFRALYISVPVHTFDLKTFYRLVCIINSLKPEFIIIINIKYSDFSN